jgi:pimeloyl-ACP methyl ester carboxylesterase
VASGSHDVGGPISWEMIAAQPERIQSLTVLNALVYQAGFNPPSVVDILQSRIHILESAKHLVQEEDPELIARYIVRFLRAETE